MQTKWGESASSDSLTLSLLAIVVVPSLSLAPNRPIRSNTPWNNRRGTDTSELKEIDGSSHLDQLDLQRPVRLGRHNRRKFPRLYARMNRDSLTRLATNRWHEPSPSGVLPLFDPLLGCPSRTPTLSTSLGSGLSPPPPERRASPSTRPRPGSSTTCLDSHAAMYVPRTEHRALAVTELEGSRPGVQRQA